MKYVLLYEATADFRSKVPAHIEAHRALWAQFQSDGHLLMIGPFTDALAAGAMGIFTNRDAADRFVNADPFVTQGIVARWTIREWNEALTP
ncbi:MAG: YciI family protein [Polyangiaceae bacterium]